MSSPLIFFSLSHSTHSFTSKHLSVPHSLCTLSKSLTLSELSLCFSVSNSSFLVRLVVELGGVEEDEEVVGSWGFCGGEVARDRVVVEVDYAGFGSGLEL